MAQGKRIASALGFAFAAWVCAEVPAHAQAWAITCTTPGQVLTSPGGYIQLTCGNSPNLMTSPHDGTLKPDTMALRSPEWCADAADFETGNDKGSALMASYIAQAYHAQSGKHLWRIRNRVSRTHLDANRVDRDCATAGDPDAGLAFDYYHQAIQYVLGRIVGRGFMWDLHNNKSHDWRLELVFGRGRSWLYHPEAHAGETTLRAFATTHEGSFATLLRDLGTRFRAAGYAAVPSASQWEPEPNDAFWRGGEVIEQYGCPTTADPVCGVLIEMHKGIYQFSEAQKRAFAATFATIMRGYLAQFGIKW